MKRLTPSAWRSAGIMLICSIVLLAVLYWPTVLSLVALWRTSTYPYGFVVIPSAFYLAWKRRKQIAELHPRPAFWMLPILAALAFGWLLGQLTATAVIQQFCLVMMLIGFIWAQLGNRVAKALLFPLTFLVFAIPMGDGLIPALQDFSAGFAVKLLDLSGIPVLLEGRYISVPFGRWEVAEACSGLRYLLSSLVVGFLFAGLMYRTWVHRVGFFLASGVVPILANGLRVYGIILTGYLGGSRIAIGVDHVIAGFLFFSIVTILLVALGLCWRERSQPDLGMLGGRLEEESVYGAQSSAGSRALYSASRNALCAALGILVLGAAPLSAKLIWNRLSRLEAVEVKPPAVASPWKPTDWDRSTWRPRYREPNSEIIQTYQSGDYSVKLYVAYYAPGQQGTKLASSSNSLFDRLEWWRSGEGSAILDVEGQRFRAHETLIQSSQTSLVVWNWYWVGGTFTSNDYAAKLLLARARLMGSREGSAALAVATEERMSQALTETVLKDFLSHASLEASLRVTRDRLP